MKVNFIKTLGDWSDVLDSCRTTVNKEDINKKSVTSDFKHRLLLSEHSPIREIFLKWKWSNLMAWVSEHFVRHKVGVDHFVGTRRTDRTGVDREKLSQCEGRDHRCTANQQTIINMSKKRLCYQASLETRQAWMFFLDSIKEDHPELVKVCVKECVYRNGLCPEIKSCGYNTNEKTRHLFEQELREYTEIIRNQVNPNTLISESGLGTAYKNDIEYNDDYIDKVNEGYEEEYFSKKD